MVLFIYYKNTTHKTTKIMKKLTLLLCIFCITFSSCNNDESTQEEESARLEKMYREIVEYSQINSKPCTDAEEWTFMNFGSSSCSGFIFYNKQINVAVFKSKVNQYNVAKTKFDKKWGVFYDCGFVPPPHPSKFKVKCYDGKPAIDYGSGSY